METLYQLVKLQVLLKLAIKEKSQISDPRMTSALGSIPMLNQIVPIAIVVHTDTSDCAFQLLKLVLRMKRPFSFFLITMGSEN